MLPVNLLNALKEYALAQRTPLPVPTTEAAAKDVPQLDLGQKVQGSVQAQVAPNVFKVNVAGQLIQMELPSSIRSGDTVALQVVSLQPRLTFSMVNSANPLSTPEQLGSAARLLSSMSQQAPDKAYVRAPQSAPLWAASQPPESKPLAGLLHEALSNSGLFYESHQAQWLGGGRSTAQLMREPQNLTPAQARAAVGSAEIANIANTVSTASNAATNTASNVVNIYDNNGMAVANEAAAKTATSGDITGKLVMAGDDANSVAISRNLMDANVSLQPTVTSPEAKAVTIPEHLQPLVQQQLNALETRQMQWQGNVWAGQDMKWEVHEQAPQTPGVVAARQWVTQIQLDLPKLGVVEATLRFNSAGLSLALNAQIPQTRAVLGNASSRLVSALSEAGIPVLATQVTNEPQKSP